MASQLSVAVNRKAVACNRDRTSTLRLLRRQMRALSGEVDGFEDDVAHLEKRRQQGLDGRLPLGHQGFDHDLQGGLPWRGLTEIHASAARDMGSAYGFVCALFARHAAHSQSALADEASKAALGPILLVSQNHALSEAGRPYGRGMHGLGLPSDRLHFVSVAKLSDALWVCEEAAATRGLGGVVLDLRAPKGGPDLHETRRLHMRAMHAGVPLFLLRQSVDAFASVAPVRLDISPAPSCDDILFAGSSFAQACPGSIGPPGFDVTIAKNKAGPAGNSFILHWNSHERIFFKASASTGVSDASAPTARNSRSGHASRYAHRIDTPALSGDGPEHAPAPRRIVAQGS
ncbi:MAG: hypothetical protein AAFY99_13740 [Pseudomonadota bacterium]